MHCWDCNPHDIRRPLLCPWQLVQKEHSHVVGGFLARQPAWSARVCGIRAWTWTFTGFTGDSSCSQQSNDSKAMTVHIAMCVCVGEMISCDVWCSLCGAPPAELWWWPQCSLGMLPWPFKQLRSGGLVIAAFGQLQQHQNGALTLNALTERCLTTTTTTAVERRRAVHTCFDGCLLPTAFCPFVSTQKGWSLWASIALHEMRCDRLLSHTDILPLKAEPFCAGLA